VVYLGVKRYSYTRNARDVLGIACVVSKSQKKKLQEGVVMTTTDGKLRILELFSGSATFSRIAKEHGHEARTLDFNPNYKADYCRDIITWDWKKDLGSWRPDVIWASPDCTKFSIANGGRLKEYWSPKMEPFTDDSKKAVEMVKTTLRIIEEIKPKRFFIENPRGMLRLMPFMPKSVKCITYCSYGAKVQKPTHIWTDSTWIWIAKPKCTAKNPTCHANRHLKDGIRAMGGAKKFERAMLPPMLCEEIIKHLETELIE